MEPSPTPTSNRHRRLVAIAVVAAALLISGIGVAVAQTGGSSSTSSTTASTLPGQAGPNGPNGKGPRGPGGAFGRFRGGPGGPGAAFGFGPGGPGGAGAPRRAIHGEFVTPDGSGGFQTVAMQTGTVTSVSSSSIAVKSADNYSRTYSVDANTVVNAGRDGISNVKTGDKVLVNAVVTSGNPAARAIQDMTTLAQIRQHWNPNAPQGSTTTTTS